MPRARRSSGRRRPRTPPSTSATASAAVEPVQLDAEGVPPGERLARRRPGRRSARGGAGGCRRRRGAGRPASTAARCRSARRVASSAQCRSSRTTRTGRRRAAARTVRAIRSHVWNASWPGPGAPASAEMTSARATPPASRPASCRPRGRAGRPARATAAARRRPASRRRRRRIPRAPWPRRARCRTSQDLPIPGSPITVARARRALARAGRARRGAPCRRRRGRRPEPSAGRPAAPSPARRPRAGVRVGQPDRERGVLAQDRLLQLRQLRARGRGRCRRRAARGRRAARRAPRPGDRTAAARGRGRPEPLAQRLARDRRLRGRQDAGVLAEREQAEEPGLLRRDPEPFERRALGEDVGVVGQVGVRFAPPGGQGLVELLDEGDRLRPARPARPVAVAQLAGQRREAALAGPNVGGEPVHVDGLGVDLSPGSRGRSSPGPRPRPARDGRVRAPCAGRRCTRAARRGPPAAGRRPRPGPRAVRARRAGRASWPGRRRSSAACGRRCRRAWRRRAGAWGVLRRGRPRRRTRAPAHGNGGTGARCGASRRTASRREANFGRYGWLQSDRSWPLDRSAPRSSPRHASVAAQAGP